MRTPQSLVEKKPTLLEVEWKDRDEILRAAKEQQRIRKHLTQKLKGKEGTEIIRKFRDSRCKL